MSILNILTVVNDTDTLADKAVDLTDADIRSSKIQTLIEDMKDTCHAAGGLGLAANQVGAPANLFIYSGDPGRATMTHQYSVLINPEVVFKKNKFTSRGEGCLSVPGRNFNVKRFKTICVIGKDEHGDVVTFKTKSKQLAKLLQHELDHLNGITIADKGKEI